MADIDALVREMDTFVTTATFAGASQEQVDALRESFDRKRAQYGLQRLTDLEKAALFCLRHRMVSSSAFTEGILTARIRVLDVAENGEILMASA